MKAVTFSSFGKLIQKRWLVVPGRKKHDVLPRGQKLTRIQDYYYIKYTISALRVMAWIVLALGLIGSLTWGITMGGIEGGVRIVIGVLASFLTWLFLLAARELLKLFMDVKENTRNTAGSVSRTSR